MFCNLFQFENISLPNHFETPDFLAEECELFEGFLDILFDKVTAKYFLQNYLNCMQCTGKLACDY